MVPSSNDALAETLDPALASDAQVAPEGRIIHLSEEDFTHGRATRHVSHENASGSSGNAPAIEVIDTRPYSHVKDELGDEPLHGIENRYAYRFIKRTFDIVFSAAVIVLFSWLFLLVAIIVKVDEPHAPILFKQRRVTKDGREFVMYKFRSMCAGAEEQCAALQELNEKDGPVFKIVNDPRITRVGKWLRKLSLDELPQFFNVIAGDMSVIGPRPALPCEVATYNDYQRQRLLIRSGITCYWQSRRNRDSISFDEWVDLDLLYIKKCSVWSDVKIVIQTVGVILTAQGS